MLRLRTLLIVFSAALFAGVAYVLREPIPEGITQPMSAKLAIVSVKLTLGLIFLSERFGYDASSSVEMLESVRTTVQYYIPPEQKEPVNKQDVSFDGVPVRIYTPKAIAGKDHVRAVVYFHGGGWVMGSVGLYDRLCSKLSSDLQALLVSVEYRLAPKHVYPAAIDDSYDAAKYFMRNAKKFKVDPNRIAMMGDSAGGNLAAAVTQRLKDNNFEPMPKMQALMYPVLQATDVDTPSYRANTDGPMITKSLMVWFVNHYLFGNQNNYDLIYDNNHTHPHVKQNMPLKYMRPQHLPNDELRKGYKPRPPFYGDVDFWGKYKPTFMDPYFAPLMTRGPDLAGLPLTFIASCQHDVLRDDAFHYAERLRHRSVKVKIVNFAHCFHGWFSYKGITGCDSFKEYYATFISFVDEHL